MNNLNLKAFQYKRMLEERRGNNFQYYNSALQKYIDENGYKFFQFTDGRSHKTIGVIIKKEATTSILEAKYQVEKLRKEGNYARIICGYEKCKQRIKFYSIIYKKKQQS